MAVQGKSAQGNQSNQNTGTSTMGAAFAAAGAQQNNANPQQTSANWDWRTMGFHQPAMSRNPAAETLSKLSKAIGDVTKNLPSKNFEYTILPIDHRNTSNLMASVIVLAMRFVNQPSFGVAYHSLILAAASETIQPRYENIGGSNVEIQRVIGDAFDRGTMETIANTVQMQFPDTPLLPASACVVPADFKVDDVDGAVWVLVANAVTAAQTELEANQEYQPDIDISKASADASLQVRASFGNPQRADALGSPVRSDVVIVFTAGNQTQQQNQQNMERVTELSALTGFVDLQYAPLAPQQNMYQMYQQPNQATMSQMYAPRFVMTQMFLPKMTTIPMQLVALVTAATLLDAELWAQTFKPTPFIDGRQNLHDIGAVGLECPLAFEQGTGKPIYKPVDTTLASFTGQPEVFGQLIRAAIREKSLSFALDVPECGDSTWYNGVFAAAAEGSLRATQMILAAAEYMTGGHFSRFFNMTDPNARVAISENNRIHLGYYTGQDGVRRDIRDIDYLAVLNRLGDEPMAVRKWSDSFVAYDTRRIELRLEDRKKIIQGICADAVFTGFARRVVFTADFMKALLAACQAAGFSPRPITPYTDMSGFARATASMSANTMMSGDVPSLFQGRSNFASVQRSGFAPGFTTGGNSRWQ